MFHDPHFSSLCSREHRYQQWEPEAHPGPHLVTHRALPTGSLQFPAEKAHARVAEGKTTKDQYSYDLEVQVASGL